MISLRADGSWIKAVALAGLVWSVAASGMSQNPFDSPAQDDLLKGTGLKADGRSQTMMSLDELARSQDGRRPANFGAVGTAAGNAGAIARAQGGRAVETVKRLLNPRIRAISGERVFDAVTGELLDDAREIMIDESQKGDYFDDGATGGDIAADDGVFTNFTVSRGEYIGQSNQRLKEMLIQALYEADRIDPLEFFGYSLMTTERVEHAPRGRRWKMVQAEKGVGYTLQQVDSSTPLEVPKYQEKIREKDEKLAGKDGWAAVFLDEYRQNKGNLKSELYPIYIPQPPTPPSVVPPTAAGWEPFGGGAAADGFPGGARGRQGGGSIADFGPPLG